VNRCTQYENASGVQRAPTGGMYTLGQSAVSLCRGFWEIVASLSFGVFSDFSAL